MSQMADANVGNNAMMSKRFLKPRYSLATMLMAITAVALMLWGVPEWREYSRRLEFERSVRQLTAGIEPDLFTALPRHSFEGSMRHINFYDADHHAINATPIFYKRYWYCIYAHQEELSDEEKRRATLELLNARKSGASIPLNALRHMDNRWSKIWVYRLKPMPPGYKAQSIPGKKQVNRHPDMSLVDRTPRDQYLTNFLEVLAGRETRDLGIQYELIHADPSLVVK